MKTLLGLATLLVLSGTVMSTVPPATLSTSDIGISCNRAGVLTLEFEKPVVKASLDAAEVFELCTRARMELPAPRRERERLWES